MQGTTSDIDAQFEEFISQFRKSYFSNSEYQLRKEIFSQNIMMIDQFNSEGGATYGVNQFSDLTFEEFSTRLSVPGKGLSNEERDDQVEQEIYPIRVQKDAIDWRSTGFVGEAKDQGGCGSCWTFSATGAIEGNCGIKTGKLVDNLSEEELVACAHWRHGKNPEFFECEGCAGGWMSRAVGYNELRGG